MNRLLSLDGGGIRALVTLEVLDRVEDLLRERSGDPKLVLADYFNMIGGTSTGAIVAACLSWGMPVDEVRSLYREFAGRVFRPLRSWRRIRYTFDRSTIAQNLQEIFIDSGGEPAKLGTDQLRTLLMLVMRNGSSGSVWPLTNSPGARYNQRDHDSCNLEYPLWKLLRASTAAPTYFPTETIRVKRRDGKEVLQEFIDGGVSPYNNPAMRMFMQSTVPELGIGMATGTENMFLLSVGTGQIERIYEHGKLGNINKLGGAIRTINALMDSAPIEQDAMCRVFGECLFGEPIDSELGDQVVHGREGKLFRYCRYNKTFSEADQERSRKLARKSAAFDLADLKSIPLLIELGQAYAQEHVSLDHLPEGGPGLGRQILKSDGSVGEPESLGS